MSVSTADSLHIDEDFEDFVQNLNVDSDDDYIEITKLLNINEIQEPKKEQFLPTAYEALQEEGFQIIEKILF